MKRDFFKLKFVFLISVLILGIQPVTADQLSSMQPLFEEALSASQTGSFTEALSLWNQFLDISPNDAPALGNRGNVRLVLGDAQGAINDQTRAIEQAPDAFDPHLNRGIAEEALKLWDQAAIDYKWILERDPGFSLALYNLGNVRGSQGDWLAAKALYHQASIASPDFVMACFNEVLASYQLGEVDQAKVDLRRLIILYPMLPDARAALSALLWREGLDGEAESNWAAVVGLDNRYNQSDWLKVARRWPPQPVEDLMAFLDLERR